MTETLTPGDFRELEAPLQVEIQASEARTALPLVVESINVLPAHRLRAEPFSLILRGPATPCLAQGTYALRHPSLGPISLFLVPVARDAQVTRYEVTFN